MIFYRIYNINSSIVIFRLKVTRSLQINLDKKLIAYIHYIRSELAINDQYELDPIQIRVLNEILFSLAAGKEIRVGDILTHQEIASQATLHAALKKLIARQLVSYRTALDTRAKYLEITNLGYGRYKELAKALGK